MIDVALIDVRPVNAPLEPKERRIVASFAVEIGGVTVRRCLLLQERDRRWVVSPRCHHEDAEVRFSPALSRYLTRIVRRELEARAVEAIGTQAKDWSRRGQGAQAVRPPSEGKPAANANTQPHT